MSDAIEEALAVLTDFRVSPTPKQRQRAIDTILDALPAFLADYKSAMASLDWDAWVAACQVHEERKAEVRRLTEERDAARATAATEMQHGLAAFSALVTERDAWRVRAETLEAALAAFVAATNEGVYPAMFADARRLAARAVESPEAK